MQIEISRLKSVVILKLQGRLDAATAFQFEQSWTQLLAVGENKLILDCAGLDYVSSAGVHSLLIASKKITDAGGKIGLCQTQGMVKEVLDISGCGSFLPMWDTSESALAALLGRAGAH
jgi:anti-anti-sigma factor